MVTGLYACRDKYSSIEPDYNPVCVYVKDDWATADMGQNGGSKVTHSHTHMCAHTHNQSHSLTGWARELEICGSQDHLELVGFLYVQMCVCVWGVFSIWSKAGYLLFPGESIDGWREDEVEGTWRRWSLLAKLYWWYFLNRWSAEKEGHPVAYLEVPC